MDVLAFFIFVAGVGVVCCTVGCLIEVGRWSVGWISGFWGKNLLLAMALEVGFFFLSLLIGGPNG